MIGTTIGHIRIEERLGEGGMGEVFRGFDEALQRRVAVKALHADRRFSPQAKARFLREARLLSKLDHPSICRIYDLLEGEDSDVLVLEYIEGSTLRTFVDGDAVDEDRALRLALQVADALQAAHREHIVHRDLKPENVMVDSQEQVKVLDFGIARSAQAPLSVTRAHTVVDPERARWSALQANTTVDMKTDDLLPTGDATGEVATLHTEEGHVLGTARYMSPEQAVGGEITEASDIYSFGIMLQEMITGEPAYGAAVGTDLLLKVFRAETARFTGTDPDLARLIGDMECVDPTARPSAASVASRLRWILGKAERARAGKIRIGLGLAAALVLAIASAITIQGRMAAGRRASVAQRFAAAAEDIEWSMRAEYLSPFHNVQPGAERVRVKMAELEDRIGDLGSLAIAPGAYALGRGHMVLGDLEMARRQLERAWNGGLQDTEVALALGTVLGKLYNNALAMTRTIADPDLRRQAVERIRNNLSVPARGYLEQCRGTDLVSPGYLEGLIAMHEEAPDRGITAVSDAGEVRPWFYEDDLLLGDLHLMAANRAYADEADSTRRRRHWDQAEAAYRRAAQTGRSLPMAWLGVCTAQTFALESAVLGEHRPASPEVVNRAREDCSTARELDPGLARALALEAQIQLVEAVLKERAGEDAAPAFAAADEMVDRVLETAPDDWRVLAGAGYVTKWRAWHLNQRGQDARDLIDKCIDIHTRLLEHSPDPVSTRSLIADSYWIGALHEAWYGDDPLTLVEKGIAVIEDGIPEEDMARYVYSTLGNLYWLQGYHQTARGLDSTGAFDSSIAAFTKVTETSTDPEQHRALALAHLNKADRLLATGKDPSASCAAVIRTAERAIELNPDYGLPYGAQGSGFRCHAKWSYTRKEELGPNIDRAVELFAKGAELSPTDVSMHYELADTLLLRAWSEREHGRSPMASVDLARKAIRRAGELNPTIALIPLVASQIERVGARWLAANAADEAAPFFARAISEIERAIEAQESNPNAHLNHARARLWRADWLHGGGRDPRTDLAIALAAADRALELQPELAGAHAVRARIFALEAELQGETEAGAAKLEQARAELARTIELIPSMRADVADLIEAIGLPERGTEEE